MHREQPCVLKIPISLKKLVFHEKSWLNTIMCPFETLYLFHFLGVFNFLSHFILDFALIFKLFFLCFCWPLLNFSHSSQFRYDKTHQPHLLQIPDRKHYFHLNSHFPGKPRTEVSWSPWFPSSACSRTTSGDKWQRCFTNQIPVVTQWKASKHWRKLKSSLIPDMASSFLHPPPHSWGKGVAAFMPILHLHITWHHYISLIVSSYYL